MCGIAGLHDKKPKSSNSGQEILEQMNLKLAHRGPDGSGLEWMTDANFGLAHRRLAIIDLTVAGAQPMSVDGRYWLSFNGEIYNYLELRKELEILGVGFKSSSDAEVLLQAYIHWGEECLGLFNGMWSFVIFDNLEKTLFCARDPYGVKPFYYLNNPEHFGFASEIKALLCIPSYEVIANNQAIIDFFAHQKIERNEEGFFKHIKELLPGHKLHYKLSTQQLNISRYYNANIGLKNSTLNEVKRSLKNAVTLRLRADVPLGFCLSGGLDSSTLLHLAYQIQKEADVASLPTGLHAFTAVHDSPLDERAWAEKMVNHTGSNWHQTHLDSTKLLSALPELIYHQDIPLLSTSTFAQSSVMKKAKAKGIKILIDGQGGDELFAGYQVFYPTFFKELFWKGHWIKMIRELKHLQNSPSSIKYIFKEWAKDVISMLPPIFQQKISALQHPQQKYLTRVSLDKRRRFSKVQDHLAYYCQEHELKSLLRWEDRCSMQFSIESRTPFSDDLHLIQQARSLKTEDLIQDGWSKYTLRKVLEGEIPKQITWRRDKKGFSVPETKWLMETSAFWTDFIEEKSVLDKSGVVDIGQLRTDLPRIFSSSVFAREQNFVFRYVCYLIWIEQFKIEHFA